MSGNEKGFGQQVLDDLAESRRVEQADRDAAFNELRSVAEKYSKDTLQCALKALASLRGVGL